jgi:hypothetical protein
MNPEPIKCGRYWWWTPELLPAVIYQKLTDADAIGYRSRAKALKAVKL